MAPEHCVAWQHCVLRTKFITANPAKSLSQCRNRKLSRVGRGRVKEEKADSSPRSKGERGSECDRFEYCPRSLTGDIGVGARCVKAEALPPHSKVRGPPRKTVRDGQKAPASEVGRYKGGRLRGHLKVAATKARREWRRWRRLWWRGC
jgi:hypothetical protein